MFIERIITENHTCSKIATQLSVERVISSGASKVICKRAKAALWTPSLTSKLIVARYCRVGIINFDTTRKVKKES